MTVFFKRELATFTHFCLKRPDFFTRELAIVVAVQVKLWDVRSGLCLLTLKDHDNFARCVGFTGNRKGCLKTPFPPPPHPVRKERTFKFKVIQFSKALVLEQ
jgi:hypothetical protein